MLSMRMSRLHNLGHEFTMLTRIGLGLFFQLFLFFFFSIKVYNLSNNFFSLKHTNNTLISFFKITNDIDLA
jgi:hypothetical protein